MPLGWRRAPRWCWGEIMLQLRRVRITEAILLAGQHRDVGEVVELLPSLAAALIALHRAVAVAPETSDDGVVATAEIATTVKRRK